MFVLPPLGGVRPLQALPITSPLGIQLLVVAGVQRSLRPVQDKKEVQLLSLKCTWHAGSRSGGRP